MKVCMATRSFEVDIDDIHIPVQWKLCSSHSMLKPPQMYHAIFIF